MSLGAILGTEKKFLKLICCFKLISLVSSFIPIQFQCFTCFFFFSFIFLHYIMICSVKVKPDLSKQDMFFNSETTQFKLLQLRVDLL